MIEKMCTHSLFCYQNYWEESWRTRCCCGCKSFRQFSKYKGLCWKLLFRDDQHQRKAFEIMVAALYSLLIYTKYHQSHLDGKRKYWYCEALQKIRSHKGEFRNRLDKDANLKLFGITLTRFGETRERYKEEQREKEWLQTTQCISEITYITF